jgi:GDP-4-dehydro-6-deoxy-D-mannose reductase
MKNVLLVGGAGFVGKHLAEHLSDDPGLHVSLTRRAGGHADLPTAESYDMDLREPAQVDAVLADSKPDCVFHMAAQSSVALSWKEPALTVDVNIKGTVNLLEAVRKLEHKPRVILIGSSEEYGRVRQNESPVEEGTPIRPMNVYAISKVCQEMLGKAYAETYGLDIVGVRSFNHIGPGQSREFVVADFCSQVAEIEKGKRQPVLRVGNLSSKRDFTDVRDVVRAYALLMEHGRTGEVYNVGSGRALAVQDVLDLILQLARKKIAVEVDPGKYRPSETPVIEADISKLVRDTGWQPLIPIRETIEETLNYWRKVDK